MTNNMKHNQGRLGFDPMIKEIGDIFFDDKKKVIDKWREFYLEAIDPFPHGMLEALGESVHIICYVDVKHACNLLNKSLHSFFLFTSKYLCGLLLEETEHGGEVIFWFGVCSN